MLFARQGSAVMRISSQFEAKNFSEKAIDVKKKVAVWVPVWGALLRRLHRAPLWGRLAGGVHPVMRGVVHVAAKMAVYMTLWQGLSWSPSDEVHNASAYIN